ncbi:MAG: hypothetical protein JW735_02505 [Prolixibacteraceae bacterium]|jgi:hypothetical protein|nr:hypothetical protein [Prolixibacteraceae bacterium]
MKRILIQIVLIAIVVFLAYMLWDTIKTPIDFEKERKARYEEVVENLIDIRKAQLAFKDVNGQFCGDWDSLVTFVKTDSIPKIRKIGMLTDSMIEAGLDEKAAMKKGLIIRDTIKVSVLEEVFGTDYNVDQLPIIPESGGEKFWLRQTIITTGSGVKVPVFEARAHNNLILAELEDDYKQQIINLNEQRRKNNRYPGLKVGSVEEPNNNVGNWE